MDPVRRVEVKHTVKCMALVVVNLVFGYIAFSFFMEVLYGARFWP